MANVFVPISYAVFLFTVQTSVIYLTAKAVMRHWIKRYGVLSC